MKRGFLAQEYKSGRTLHPPTPPPASPKIRHGMEHLLDDPVKLAEAFGRASLEGKKAKAREAQAEEKRVNALAGPNLKTTMKEIFKRFHATGYICLNSFRLRGQVHSVFVFIGDEAKTTFKQHFVPFDLTATLCVNRITMRSFEETGVIPVVDDAGAGVGDLLLVEYPLLCAPGFCPDEESISTSYEQLVRKVVSRLSIERQKSFITLPNARKGDAAAKQRGREYTGIINTNYITIHGPPSDKAISYRGIFTTLSRVNHSCRPNVCLHWDGKSASMSARAIRSMSPEEEITFSYLTPRELLKSVAERRATLQRKYHFTCLCSACDASPQEVAASDARRAELARTPAPRHSAWVRWAGNASLEHEAEEYSESYLINPSRHIWELYEREGLVEPEDGVDAYSHVAQLMFCYASLSREREAQFWAKKVIARASMFQQDSSLVVIQEAKTIIMNPTEAIAWNSRERLRVLATELDARQIF